MTNVAAFGAFVDIGVHQDGLVHVSQLAERFVMDPHEVVKAGDVVQVRVTEVDVPRKRIGLSMKKYGGASAKEARDARDTPRDRPRGKGAGKAQHQAGLMICVQTFSITPDALGPCWAALALQLVMVISII